ncbi:BTAD domain-containing putative transcriptional regulator [Streptosporangium saharense]|uniref:DNA-binding SARP family transcriptional activator n=1 Tax=Streptosporangium saharense TaxID=1706840 RepID=A0A7W7VPX1_9ACTN|nr:BTAD domain-containing putative transcriptional regulator [Streptosporangium saharense]MBB4918133.1 DNA-binding SARP family transcriptional activator [Streptosporangium saharense]
MDFLVLGALTITHRGRSTAPTAAKDRAFLGELLAHPGEVVSTEHLADALWPDKLPADPANAVQVRASRLRTLLRSLTDSMDPTLLSRPGGYELSLGEAGTDLARLRRALSLAEEEKDPRAAAKILREGLALWRGEPFCDVPQTPCVLERVAHAQELRLSALETYADLTLSAGDVPPTLVAELTELADRTPLREPLHLRLMRALHASGRSAEALTRYERLRRTLRDELGTDPGPELRELHREILTSEPDTPERAVLQKAGETPTPVETAPGRARFGNRARRTAVAAVAVCLLLGAGLWLWLPRQDRMPPEAHLVRPIPGDRSRLARDVTYPDGSTVRAGETFVKTWQLDNVGTVPWRDRYLYRQWPWDGEDLCQTEHRSVRVPDTDPGGSALVSVEVRAPMEPTRCKVYWKMVDADGNHFMPHLSGIFFDVTVVR